MISEALVIFVVLGLTASILIWPIVIYRKLDLIDARIDALETFWMEFMCEDGEPEDEELPDAATASLATGRLQ